MFKMPSIIADTHASSCLLKSFTPVAVYFCGKAVQILWSASFNSEIVLGLAAALPPNMLM